MTDRLSDRQRTIADLVARGYSNPQIARQLHVADQTVKNYLADIYSILGWTGDARNQRVLLAMWWRDQMAVCQCPATRYRMALEQIAVSAPASPQGRLAAQTVRDAVHDSKNPRTNAANGVRVTYNKTDRRATSIASPALTVRSDVAGREG